MDINREEKMLARIEETISERKLVESESPVLLMVSGGSDSTAMAYLAKKLHGRGSIAHLAMLHVNHQIRKDDSDKDQRFVEELAELIDIPLFICEIDIPGEVKRSGENLEAAARRERYLAATQALESFCLHISTPYSLGRIFTAHTQDDRVENFYMRSIVGTGPGGFRSMLYRNGPIVRPLLDLNREDLREYISQRAVNHEVQATDEAGNFWREDATNAHTDRFRAYVRHEIMPLAKKRNPQLLDTLCRSMNLIADEDDMIEEYAETLENECILWEDQQEGGVPDHTQGCTLLPSFAAEKTPLQRRLCVRVLQKMLGSDVRIETSSIDAILSGFVDGTPLSGYTGNIQGNLALSANKKGLRIEQMSSYRARRKNIQPQKNAR